MLSQCPLCMAPVPDDFGLLECPGCQAQLIVHMDGRVEHAGAEILGGAEPTQPQGLVQASAKHFTFDQPALEFGEEAAPEPEAEFIEDEPLEFSEAAPEDEQPPELIDDSPVFDGSDDQVAEEATRAYSPDGASSDLSDIAQFGNSDVSSSGDGSLRYNIFVSGIDTTDVREDFREAITDRKLIWDTEQILRSLKNGEVSISNVPAAKAYIFISRLRTLPVHVRWEQYAISQT